MSIRVLAQIRPDSGHSYPITEYRRMNMNKLDPPRRPANSISDLGVHQTNGVWVIHACGPSNLKEGNEGDSGDVRGYSLYPILNL